MEDLIHAAVARAIAAAGFTASHAWARYWYAETCKIGEQVPDPAARWEIMTTALRRIGWDDDGAERA